MLGRVPPAWWVRLASSRSMPWLVAAVAVALALPSVTSGWRLDDHLHRFYLALWHDGTPLGPWWDLYQAAEGDPTLTRARMDLGYTPTLRKLIDKHNWDLRKYPAGLPSATPAAQAAIFFGEKPNIPAFRWYEKESGRAGTWSLRRSCTKQTAEQGRTSRNGQKGRQG